MTLDRYAAVDLNPEAGEVLDDELVVTDDVLVKVFALGPGASLDPHEHDASTNVFHVLEGTLTVVQEDKREQIEAPGVVLHDPGVSHGAENQTDQVAVFTASLCPLPA